MIVGLGCLAHDHVLITEAPWRAGKGRIRQSTARIGGNARNALATVAALDYPAAYLATVGTSSIGDFAMEDLHDHHIDTQFIERREGADPVTATITITSDGERYIAFDDSSLATTPLPGDDTIDRALALTAVLLIDGTTAPPNTTTVGHRARALGIPVVLDAERVSSPAVLALMNMADHVVIPLGFGSELSGASDPAAITESIWQDGHVSVVLTDGPRGSYIAASPDDVTHVPAFAVTAIDTTGCGDAFHGAYAWAMAQGQDLHQRVLFASATAAVIAALPPDAKRVASREAIDDLLATRVAP